MPAPEQTREELMERFVEAHALDTLFELLLHPGTFPALNLRDDYLYPPALVSAAIRTDLAEISSNANDLCNRLWPAEQDLDVPDYQEADERAWALIGEVLLRMAAHAPRFAAYAAGLSR